MTLHALGLKHGTDKAFHSYLHHYDRAFSHLRAQKIKLLEIGVFRGASVRMWRDYFPNAEIHVIDIKYIELPEFLDVKAHRADCDNEDALIRLSEELGGLDIIIDDGGHTMRQQQNTLKVFWEKLRSRGFYVIEDLHTSLASYPEYNPESQPTTLRLLESFIDEIDFESSYISSAGQKKISREIKSINLVIENRPLLSGQIFPSKSITSLIQKI